MTIELSEELEEFYQDRDNDVNKKNLKLLIDEWEGLDCMFSGLETFDIKPVLNTDAGMIEIDIKKELKKDNSKNLF